MQRKGMKKIVHKPYLKKLLLILIIVMSMGLVYAAGYNDNFFPQAKVVKCYPNPATSVVNFEYAAPYTLQIYSFTGKKMTEVIASANKVSVILNNDFYRGIYIYQLRDKTGRIIETGKFQVVK
jgi:hypothetical protein